MTRKWTRLTYGLLATLTSFFVYSTFLGIFWKLDPHHDGYVYLQTHLAQFGLLPPQYSRSAYGIAQPVVENFFISALDSSLIIYRSIAFVLILGTTLLIYKVMRLKTSKAISIIFSLLWLSANPLWANSIIRTPISIQTPWPNLWVQFLTLLALLLTIKNQKFKNSKFILVGGIASTLPFFRIQGLISTVFIIILVLLTTRGYKQFFLGFAATLTLWVLLVMNNGGMIMYFNNIILDPIEGLNRYTTIEYQLNFTKGLLGYYLFIYWLYLTFTMLLDLAAKKKLNAIQLMRSPKMYKKFYFLITAIALVQYLQTPILWRETIANNSSSFVLDLAIPLAVETLLIFLRKNRFKLNEVRTNFNLTIGLAILVLVNLIHQYPLPDLGHRWWASGINAVFIFLLFYNHKPSFILLQKDSGIKILIACTFSLSLINAVMFMQKDSRIIEIDSPRQFNGIKISNEDENRALNFLNSIEIINYLEKNQVNIDYKCRDGLYYVRDENYTNKAIEALDFLSEITTIESAKNGSVLFYCDIEDSLLNTSLPEFNIVVGKSQTDIFVFHESLLPYFSEAKEIMRQ
jgi:hypothetical protein